MAFNYDLKIIQTIKTKIVILKMHLEKDKVTSYDPEDDDIYSLRTKINDQLILFFEKLSIPITDKDKNNLLHYAKLISALAEKRYRGLFDNQTSELLTIHLMNLIELAKIYLGINLDIAELSSYNSVNQTQSTSTAKKVFLSRSDVKDMYELNEVVTYFENIISKLYELQKIRINRDGSSRINLDEINKYSKGSYLFKLMHAAHNIKLKADNLRHNPVLYRGNKPINDDDLISDIDNFLKTVDKNIYSYNLSHIEKPNIHLKPEPQSELQLILQSQPVITTVTKADINTKAEISKSPQSATPVSPTFINPTTLKSDNSQQPPAIVDLKTQNQTEVKSSLPNILPSDVQRAIEKLSDHLDILQNDTRDHTYFCGLTNLQVHDKAPALRQFIDGFTNAYNNSSEEGRNYLDQFYNKELMLVNSNPAQSLYDIVSKGQNITTRFLSFFSFRTTTLELIDNLKEISLISEQLAL